MQALFALGDTIARGAAMMTGTALDSSAHPRLGLERPLQQADRRSDAREHQAWSACPRGVKKIRLLARALQRELGNKADGLSPADSRSARVERTARNNRTGGGSDDIGDVSWNVPTVTLRFPSNIPGLPGHNWANAIAMATPIAHKGAIAGAKVQAADDARPVHASPRSSRRRGLLQRRADEGHEVQAVHRAG